MDKLKMSRTDRTKLRKAKASFAKRMRKMYPTYTRANWAKTSWRINNPQFLGL